MRSPRLCATRLVTIATSRNMKNLMMGMVTIVMVMMTIVMAMMVKRGNYDFKAMTTWQDPKAVRS